MILHWNVCQFSIENRHVKPIAMVLKFFKWTYLHCAATEKCSILVEAMSSCQMRDHVGIKEGFKPYY